MQRLVIILVENSIERSDKKLWKWDQIQSDQRTRFNIEAGYPCDCSMIGSEISVYAFNADVKFCTIFRYRSEIAGFVRLMIGFISKKWLSLYDNTSIFSLVYSSPLLYFTMEWLSFSVFLVLFPCRVINLYFSIKIGNFFNSE